MEFFQPSTMAFVFLTVLASPILLQARRGERDHMESYSREGIGSHQGVKSHVQSTAIHPNALRQSDITRDCKIVTCHILQVGLKKALAVEQIQLET